MNDSAPLVSIIVLNFNSARYIRNCLRALEADVSYAPRELIVVDNASVDGSAEIVAQEFPHVALLRNARNLGFGGGCNAGMRAAHGEIFILLNVDTEVRPGWCAASVRPFAQNERIVLVGAKALFPDGRIQHGGGVLWPNGLSDHFGYGEPDNAQCDVPGPRPYVTGCSLAVRRSFYAEVGGFDEGYFPAYFEDADLGILARRLGYLNWYEPTAVLIHYESFATKRFSPRYLYFYHRSRLRLILKHGGWRYFWKSFLPEEWRLLHRGLELQGWPLVQAYLHALWHSPAIWWERRWGRYAHLRRRFTNEVLACPRTD